VLFLIFFFLNRVVLSSAAHHEEDKQNDSQNEDNGDDDDDNDSPNGESTAVLIVIAASIERIGERTLARIGLLVVREAICVAARFGSVGGRGAIGSSEAGHQSCFLGGAGIVEI
jgi:hypothetical protein